MHQEILTSQQADLLPLISTFKKEFYLAGGTGVALHIGHRRSIDFDLFSNKTIQPIRIKNQIRTQGYHFSLLHETFDQVHLMVNDVKLTFFNYPYEIEAKHTFEKKIRMPDLLTLSAMKAIALGGRAKWKDYVDLYFLLKYHFDLIRIEERASQLFGDAFSAKLFRQQLVYFKDIDYSEKVNYIAESPTEEEIKKFLISATLIDL